MTAVLALSLSSEIEKYGAYAGMAAIVGLGVLSLLYFAQAREVKRLREWAGRAPERDAELQQRAVAEAQRRAAQPAARPQPARPGGPATPAAVAAAAAAKAPQQPAVPGAPGTQPGTPTGPKPPVPATAAAVAGAAAVTAAGTPAPAGAAPATPGAPAPAPAATSTATPGGPAAKPGPVTPAVAAAATTPPSATPAKPAPGDAASAEPGPAAPAEPPAPKPAAPPAAVSSPTPPPAPSRPRPRPAAAPVRATRPEGPVTPREGTRPPAQHGSRRGLLAVVIGTIAIAAVAVLLITQVFSGDDSPTTEKPNSVGTATTPAAGDGDGGTAAKPQPKRETTQVAVFNGTTVTGLARAAADKLTTAGYKNVSPVTTDTTNQARATTVVYWQSGSRREGVDVAKLIGVGKSALQPMDQNARVLGGGAPVVVIVGADQAQ